MNQRINYYIFQIIFYVALFTQYSQAEDYFVPPPNCPEFTRKEVTPVWGVPQKYLPQRIYNQGGTGTCGFHAATAVLNALYKYANPRASDELDPIGPIFEYGKCKDKLDSSTDPISLLIQALMDGKVVGNRSSVDVDTLQRLDHHLKSIKEGCNSNACKASDHRGCLVDCCKNNISTLIQLGIQPQDFIEVAQRVSESELSPAQELAKKVVSQKKNIPAAKVRTWDVFDPDSGQKEAAKIILDHKESNPQLPLLLVTCIRDEDPSYCTYRHAVALRQVERINCVNSLGKVSKSYFQVYLLNSWGPNLGTGPLDLDKISKGISRHGTIAAIKPCPENETQKCRQLPLENFSTSNQLFHYASAGKVEALKSILTLGQNNINKAITGGATPFHVAAKDGHKEIVELFLKQPGIDINKSAEDGTTPLFMAAKNGHKEIVEVFLKQPGIDINKARTSGATPLFIAAQEGHKEIVEVFLKQPGIDINKARTSGATPLFMAAQNGHKEIVELLLKHSRIDVNKSGEDGATPFYIAAKNGHKEVVELLLKHPEIEINKAMTNGATPLVIFVQEGHKEIVEFLLKHSRIDINKSAAHGVTPLIMAAQDGHKEIVELFLKQPGIDINKARTSGATPLFMAAQNGHKEIVELLLKRDGIDINKSAEDGATPLIVAAEDGHKEIVELLLKRDGIDINKSAEDGATPLFFAVQNGHKEIVELFLKQPGIDINKATITGATALFVAVQNGYKDIVELLLGQNGININYKLINGETPLMKAQENGNKEIAELLRKHGAK